MKEVRDEIEKILLRFYKSRNQCRIGCIPDTIDDIMRLITAHYVPKEEVLKSYMPKECLDNAINQCLDLSKYISKEEVGRIIDDKIKAIPQDRHGEEYYSGQEHVLEDLKAKLGL
jgi:hypothetical protein